MYFYSPRVSHHTLCVLLGKKGAEEEAGYNKWSLDVGVDSSFTFWGVHIEKGQPVFRMKRRGALLLPTAPQKEGELKAVSSPR